MVMAPGGNLPGNMPGAAKPADVYTDDITSGNLLFYPDAIYNIGANGVNRPGSLYVATSIQVGTGNGAIFGALYGNIQLGGGAPLVTGGIGAPSVAMGNDGSFYFRSDTPGTTNQRIYVKSAGAWVGIV